MLASVVTLKSDITGPRDKAALAEALFYLWEPPTGSMEGNAQRLGSEIDEYVHLRFQFDISESFVRVLGRIHHTLHTTFGLTEQPKVD